MNFSANYDSDSSRELREIKKNVNNVNVSVICLCILLLFVLYEDYKMNKLFTTIMASLAKELECIKKVN
jgi:hypothetical protein